MYQPPYALPDKIGVNNIRAQLAERERRPVLSEQLNVLAMPITLPPELPPEVMSAQLQTVKSTIDTIGLRKTSIIGGGASQTMAELFKQCDRGDGLIDYAGFSALYGRRLSWLRTRGRAVVAQSTPAGYEPGLEPL